MLLSRNRLLLWTVISAILLSSCEKNTNNSINKAASFEGQWNCNEHSSFYKSELDIFIVYITINQDDTNKLLIKNFYDIGNNYYVEAVISGLNLSIPVQKVDGFTFQGSGFVKANYSQIDWTYSVDDGSGEIDRVTSIYTKP